MILAPNPYGTIIHPSGKPELKDHQVRIFVPRYNSPSKPADAMGAFHPGANKFCEAHGISRKRITYINNLRPYRDRATELLERMSEEYYKVAVWVFFCHGYMHGIQFGLRSPTHPAASGKDIDNFEQFCKYQSSGHPASLSIFYACSTGDDPDDDPLTAPGYGDGNFADTHRDKLVSLGSYYAANWAHFTAGHTFFNPNVIKYQGNGPDDPHIGGEVLFQPSTDEYSKFAGLLASNSNNALWLRFPFMTPFQIRSEISSHLD